MLFRVDKSINPARNRSLTLLLPVSHYRPLSSLYDVGRIEVKGRRGRRGKQVLDDLKGT